MGSHHEFMSTLSETLSKESEGRGTNLYIFGFLERSAHERDETLMTLVGKAGQQSEERDEALLAVVDKTGGQVVALQTRKDVVDKAGQQSKGQDETLALLAVVDKAGGQVVALQTSFGERDETMLAVVDKAGGQVVALQTSFGERGETLLAVVDKAGGQVVALQTSNAAMAKGGRGDNRLSSMQSEREHNRQQAEKSTADIAALAAKIPPEHMIELAHSIEASLEAGNIEQANYSTYETFLATCGKRFAGAHLRLAQPQSGGGCPADGEGEYWARPPWHYRGQVQPHRPQGSLYKFCHLLRGR